MRGFNVKKLVAIGTGAALIGAALAPVSADLRDDLYDSDGTPLASVVVGDNAALSDVVWAGNIAAAMALKAYSEVPITCDTAGSCATDATPTLTGLMVDLSVGGTTTVTGGKTFFEDMNSMAGTSGRETNFYNQQVTYSSIPNLYYDSARSQTYNGSSYTTTLQEKLNFTLNAEFDDVVKKALAGRIGIGQLKYVLSLGTGVNAWESGTGTVKYTDDGNDNVRFPIFGDDYLLKTADYNSGSLELVKSAAEKTYVDGDKIEGLEGKDGETYYIEVGGGVTISNVTNVELRLYKEDGTLVQSDNFPAGDVRFYSDDTGEEILQTLVNISAIGTTTTADATVYKPQILVGSNRLLIYHDKGFSLENGGYDSSLTDSEYLYKAKINWGDAATSATGKIKDINIENWTQLSFTGQDALGVGDEATFPGEMGSVKFLGFQLPGFESVSKTERTTVVTFGNEKLTYKDSTFESSHELPFYRDSLSLSNLGSWSTSIDGKNFWAMVNTADKNVLSYNSATSAYDGSHTCIGDNNYINGQVVEVSSVDATNATINGTATYEVGDTVDINGQHFTYSGHDTTVGCVYLTADGNVTLRKDSATGELVMDYFYADENVGTGMPIGFEGTSDVSTDYIVMVDESASSGTSDTANIWLFLDGQNIATQYGKLITVKGTDTAEDGSGTMDVNYYEPNHPSLPSSLNGSPNYTANDHKIAWFELDEDEGGVKDFNVFIDTVYDFGNLVNPDDTTLSNYPYEVHYLPNGTDDSVTWSLSESPTKGYPTEGYSDWGTKVSVSDDIATFTFPENRPQLEVLVSGTGTSTEVSGGEDFEGVESGEIVTTTDGTKVTVTDITYVSNVCEGTVGGDIVCNTDPSLAITPVSRVGYLVGLASEAPLGTRVVVGGWKVNSLASGVKFGGVDIESELKASGDFVAEKADNGDYIVAGWTASDTVAAAKEFIDMLEAI